MPRTRKPSKNAKIEVRKSPIHGRGLFAIQPIKKGEKIGRYEGPTVTEDEDGDHVLWVWDEDEDREYGIDGKNELRYVNHSRRPNANFEGEILEALRPIRPGDEITHDYGQAWAEVD